MAITVELGYNKKDIYFTFKVTQLTSMNLLINLLYYTQNSGPYKISFQFLIYYKPSIILVPYLIFRMGACQRQWFPFYIFFVQLLGNKFSMNVTNMKAETVNRHMKNCCRQGQINIKVALTLLHVNLVIYYLFGKAFRMKIQDVTQFHNQVVVADSSI